MSLANSLENHVIRMTFLALGIKGLHATTDTPGAKILFGWKQGGESKGAELTLQELLEQFTETTPEAQVASLLDDRDSTRVCPRPRKGMNGFK